MNKKEEVQNERLALFQRLTKQKDAILTASQEIENLRKQFLKANKKDDDGSIESEIQKQIYIIISALSELSSYAKDPGISQILLTTANVATYHIIGFMNKADSLKKMITRMRLVILPQVRYLMLCVLLLILCVSNGALKKSH